MSVFDDAEAFWHAGLYRGSGDLLDLSGNGHDAAISGAQFLPHQGMNYIWVPPDNDTPYYNDLYTQPQTYQEPSTSFEVRHFGRIYQENSQSWWTWWNYAWWVRISVDGYMRFYWQESDSTAHTVDRGTFPDELIGEWVEVSWLVEWDGSTNYTLTSRYRVGGVGDWTVLDSGTTAATGAGGFKSQTGYGINISENNRNDNLHVARLTYLVDGIIVSRFQPSDIYPDETALDLDGTTDYGSVPHESAFDLQGTDIVRAYIDITLEDWTRNQMLLNHEAGGYGWAWEMSASGYLTWWVDQGGPWAGYQTAAPLGFRDGSRQLLRVDWDPSTGDHAFYYGTDRDTWLLLKAGTSSATTITPVSAILAIGADSYAGRSCDGQIHWAKITQGNTTVLEVDFDRDDVAPGQTSMVADTGQTITLAGNARIWPYGQVKIADSTPTLAWVEGAYNRLETPNSAEYIPDVSLDARIRITNDFAPGTSVWQALGGVWEYPSDYSWCWFLTDAGYIEVDLSWNGTGVTDYVVSSAGVPFTGDWRTAWVRFYYDVATGGIRFFYSLDETNDHTAAAWTEIGTEQFVTTGLDLYDSAAPLLIAAYNDALSDRFAGKVHASALIVDGTEVFEADCTGLVAGVTEFTETYSATVSVAGGTEIEGGPSVWIVPVRHLTGVWLTMVDRPMFVLDGIDDKLTVPHHADLNFDFTTDECTVMVFCRSRYNPSYANPTWMAKRISGSTTGWHLQLSSWPDVNQFYYWAGGSQRVDTFLWATNQLSMDFNHAAVQWGKYDQSAPGGHKVWAGGQNTFGGAGVADASPADASNTDDLTIGANLGGSPNYMKMEFYAAATWRRVLTSDELVEVYERLNSIYTQTEPELRLRMAFDDEPLETSPVWYDITEDLVDFEAKRGGSSGRRDEVKASVARFRLENHHARYSPWNSYYNMKPTSRIELRATWQAIPYPVFTGYLEAVDVDWIEENYSKATLRATDGFKALAYHETAEPQVEEPSGTRVGNWLDEASWPSAWRILDPGVYSIAAHSPQCEQVLGLIQETARSEWPGFFFIGPDGFAYFYDSAHSFAPGPTYGDGPDELPYESLQIDWDDEQIWNEITVSATDGSALSVEDSDSIDMHFRRTLKQFEMHAVDSSDLTAAGNTLLAKLKDPHVRISRLNVDPLGSSKTWGYVLGNDLGTPLTVVRRPLVGPSLRQTLKIKGVTLRGGAQQWSATYDLGE